LQGIGKFPRLACVVVAVEQKKALIREEAYLGLLANVISLFFRINTLHNNKYWFSFNLNFQAILNVFFGALSIELLGNILISYKRVE